MKTPCTKRICLLDDRFEIVDAQGGGRTTVKWSEVEIIVAFKRDYFAYDCLCVDFQLSDGIHVEADEQMDNFIELMEEAPKRCNGCVTLDGWYSSIVVPAFETKMTVLYRRSAIAYSGPI